MDKRKNQEIRRAIEAAELRYWVVAEAYGVHEGNFSRLLRREVDDDTKEQILAIIGELKNGGIQRGGGKDATR